MEVTQNDSIMKSVFASCTKNKSLRSEKKGNECKMTSIWLRFSASEFLHINRYLDLDEEFYKALSPYCSVVPTINVVLEQWIEKGEYMENWLLGNEEEIRKTFAAVLERALKLN